MSIGHLTHIKEDCDDTIIDNGTQSCNHNSTSSNSVDNNTFEGTYTQSKALSQPLSNCNNSVIDEGSQLCHNSTSISNNVTSSMFESTLPLENSLSQPISKSSKWNKYSAVVNAATL